MTGSPTATLTLFVLFVIVAAGLATFFRRKLTALGVLVGVPVALFLNSALGGLYTLLLVTVCVMAALLLHTISDTVSLLRAADSRRGRPPTRRETRPARRPDRSRIAA